jgi:hypothetical protein
MDKTPKHGIIILLVLILLVITAIVVFANEGEEEIIIISEGMTLEDALDEYLMEYGIDLTPNERQEALQSIAIANNIEFIVEPNDDILAYTGKRAIAIDPGYLPAPGEREEESEIQYILPEPYRSIEYIEAVEFHDDLYYDYDNPDPIKIEKIKKFIEKDPTMAASFSIATDEGDRDLASVINKHIRNHPEWGIEEISPELTEIVRGMNQRHNEIREIEGWLAAESFLEAQKWVEGLRSSCLIR